MYEWSEEQLAIRDAVRRFVEEEIKPNVEELEHGDTPPYDVIRKLYQTFGLDVMARESAKKAIERKANPGRGPGEGRGWRRRGGHDVDPDHRAVPLLPGDRDRARGEHRPGRRHHHEERHAGPDGALGPRPDDDGQESALGPSPSPTRAPTRWAA